MDSNSKITKQSTCVVSSQCRPFQSDNCKIAMFREKLYSGILAKNELTSVWVNYPFKNLGNTLAAGGSCRQQCWKHCIGFDYLSRTPSRQPSKPNAGSSELKGLNFMHCYQSHTLPELVWQPRVIKRKLSQRECLWRSEASTSLHTLSHTLALYL